MYNVRIYNIWAFSPFYRIGTNGITNLTEIYIVKEFRCRVQNHLCQNATNAVLCVFGCAHVSDSKETWLLLQVRKTTTTMMVYPAAVAATVTKTTCNMYYKHSSCRV